MPDTLYLKKDCPPATQGRLPCGKYLVGRLVKDGNLFTFNYLSFADGEPVRFQDVQFLPLRFREYTWKGFPGAFDEMVVNPSRPDVPRILALFGMKEYDAWELLKRSKGKSFTNFWIFETGGDGVKCNIAV